MAARVIEAIGPKMDDKTWDLIKKEIEKIKMN